MSYDIDLVHPVTREILQLATKHQMTGGTFCLGGTTDASLNITYNYSRLFVRVLGEDGIRAIYGMTGAKSICLLEKAASVLGDDVDDDYWQPTEGNAKASLLQLVALAELRPDGVWQGD